MGAAVSLIERSTVNSFGKFVVFVFKAFTPLVSCFIPFVNWDMLLFNSRNSVIILPMSHCTRATTEGAQSKFSDFDEKYPML